MLDSDWMKQGKCRELSQELKNELFFPTKNPNVMSQDAKKVCADCPVLQQCKTWVFLTERPSERYGNVAGMSTTERKRFRRAQRPGVSKVEPTIDGRKAKRGQARKPKNHQQMSSGNA